jgi:hypothetical protein
VVQVLEVLVGQELALELALALALALALDGDHNLANGEPPPLRRLQVSI